MRTIKEASIEYAKRTDKANAEFVAVNFIAGVKFAQQWISVRDELPKENSMCICKCSDWNEEKYQVAKFEDGIFDYSDCPNPYFNNYVTHWRVIELI